MENGLYGLKFLRKSGIFALKYILAKSILAKMKDEKQGPAFLYTHKVFGFFN